MGMPIAVQPPRVVGNVAVFDTDRSLSGQDGSSYSDPASAAADLAFPGRLADRIFGADAAVENVFVASSQVVVRRRPGWDSASGQRISAVIAGFFVHNRG